MLAHADAATREENDQRVELNSEQIVTTFHTRHPPPSTQLPTTSFVEKRKEKYSRVAESDVFALCNLIIFVTDDAGN